MARRNPASVPVKPGVDLSLGASDRYRHVLEEILREAAVRWEQVGQSTDFGKHVTTARKGD